MIDVSRQRRVGIILSYLSLILNTLISLFYTPLMLSSLGQSEYGLYQLAFSVTNYLTLLNLGLSGSYNKFFTKLKADENEEGLKRLNAMFVVIFAAMSVVAIVIGLGLSLNVSFIFKKSLTPEEIGIGRTLLVLMTFNVAVTLSTTPYTSSINANERFIFYRIVLIATYILHGAGSVAVLLLGGKSIALTLVSLTLAGISIIVQFIFCKLQLRYTISFRGFRYSEFKELFVFSMFILLYDLINQLNWGIDKIILGIEVGTVGVAVYGIASQLNTYYMKISTTISTVFIPQVNQMVVAIKDQDEKRKSLSDLMIRIGRIQFFAVGLVLSGYIIFGKQFIALWAGVGYEKSYYIGLWLMIPITVDLIQNIGTHISRAEDLHRPITACFFFVALTNAILSVIFCRLYGAVGCAMATAFTVICGHGFFLNWYYSKKIGLHIKCFWLSIIRIIPALIPCFLIGLTCSKFILIRSYTMLGICIIGYTLLYVISVYFIAMNNSEKNMVKRVFRYFHLYQ